jgi:hypothetical protein
MPWSGIALAGRTAVNTSALTMAAVVSDFVTKYIKILIEFERATGLTT